MTICISSAPTAPLPLRSSAPLTAAPLPFPGTSQLGTPALGCSAAAFSLCQPITQPCLQPCCSLQPVTQLHWAPQTPTALQRSGCWLQGLIHPADPTAGTCHQGPGAAPQEHGTALRAGSCIRRGGFFLGSRGGEVLYAF